MSDGINDGLPGHGRGEDKPMTVSHGGRVIGEVGGSRHQKVEIDYTNWKGSRRWRVIDPLFVWNGVSEFHKEAGAQMLLRAVDMEDNGPHCRKDFPIKNIHAVKIMDMDATIDELLVVASARAAFDIAMGRVQKAGG